MFFKKTTKEPKITDFEITLRDEFSKFKNSNRDRLVLSTEEMDQESIKHYSDIIPDSWISFEDGQHEYYPFEVLEKEEQNKITNEVQYQVIALVAPKALGFAPYNTYGIEVISRVKSKAMMPEFEATSPMKYHSVKNFFPICGLDKFIEVAEAYTSDELKKDIEFARSNYDAKTTELLAKDRDKRNAALEKLEARDAPADEFLFQEMREAIQQAKTDVYK